MTMLVSIISRQYAALPSLKKLLVKVRPPELLRRHQGGVADEQQCAALVYKELGDPSKVLKATTATRPSSVSDNEVVIRMLAAPINPADINMIQGVYPIRPPLPAVGGNEGVGQVAEVGKSVTGLQKGDWVVPSAAGWGTWRTLAVCPADEVTKIPNDIPVVSAATLAVNPCTAYRMLVDFKNLVPGDCVIQNGANSGVGQAVIQIAASMSLQTINIVRAGRPNQEKLVKQLKKLGATHVVTDEFLKSPEMNQLIKSLPNGRPKLALNCVGGKVVADMLKYMAAEAIVVSYGGMSKQPMMIPVGPLIFNDIQFRGYWNTHWYSRNRNSPAAGAMWEYLANMVRLGHFKSPPHRLVLLSDFKSAIERAMEPYTTEKQIFVFNDSIFKCQ